MKSLLIFVCCILACSASPVPISGRCDYICADILRPVCGTDGHTYGNPCSLARSTCMSTTVTLKHEGVCAGYVGPFPPGKRAIDGTIDKRASNCQTNMACFALWDPVCGSDGMTYGNSCELSTRTCGLPIRVWKLHNGACDGTEALPKGK